MTGMGNQGGIPPEPDPRTSWTSFSSGAWQIVNGGNWLAKHRDFILVAAAAVYVLGYLVWALNAWDQGLGLLPAADLQYFVAGFIPAVTLITAWALFRAVVAVCAHFYPIVAKRRWYQVLMVAFIFGVFALIGNDTFTVVGSLILLTGWVLFFVKLPGFSNSISRKLAERVPSMSGGDGDVEQRRVLKWLDRFKALLKLIYSAFVWGIRVAVGIPFAFLGLAYLAVIIWFLVFIAYTEVPQELGGFKPRCAHLELDTAMISNETRQQLMSELDDATMLGVVRTGEVEILFDKGGLLLIRAKPESPNGARQTIYRMRGDTVLSVVGCS